MKSLTIPEIAHMILTLSQTTNYGHFQTQDIAGGDFKFDENGSKFFKQVENTVGKREISPFATVFSKGIYCRHIKTRACLGKS